MFPTTPATLLKRLSALDSDTLNSEWTAFVELYETPLRLFVKSVSSTSSETEMDDIVQEVFLRLVKFLRTGAYDRTKGRLRSVLAQTARRILLDHYRADKVRPTVLAEGAAEDLADRLCQSTFETSDPGEILDAKWRLALRQAAEQHVFSHMALSEQTKAVYRALESGRSIAEVADAWSLSRDAVKQIKSRVTRAIEAVEARMKDHD